MHLHREVRFRPSSMPWLWWTACTLSAGLAAVATLGITLNQLHYPSPAQQQTHLLGEVPIEFRECDTRKEIDIVTTLSYQSLRELAINHPRQHENRPYYEGGDLVGYKVVNLSSQSLFFAIGIRNGDVTDAVLSDLKLPNSVNGNYAMGRHVFHLRRAGMPIRIHVHIPRSSS